MSISITNELVKNLTASELHLLLSVMLSDTPFTIDGYHKQSGIAHRTIRQIISGLESKGYVVKYPIQQNRVVYSFHLIPVQTSPVQTALVFEFENKVEPGSNSLAQTTLGENINMLASPINKSPVNKSLVTNDKKTKQPVQNISVQYSPVADVLKSLKKLGYSNGYISGAVQVAMENLPLNSSAEDIIEFILKQNK